MEKSIEMEFDTILLGVRRARTNKIFVFSRDDEDILLVRGGEEEVGKSKE